METGWPFTVPLLSAVAMCLAFQNPKSGSVFQEDYSRDDVGSLGTVMDAEHLFLVTSDGGPWGHREVLQMQEQGPLKSHACAPLWVSAPGS